MKVINWWILVNSTVFFFFLASPESSMEYCKIFHAAYLVFFGSEPPMLGIILNNYSIFALFVSFFIWHK